MTDEDGVRGKGGGREGGRRGTGGVLFSGAAVKTNVASWVIKTKIFLHCKKEKRKKGRKLEY